MDHAIVTSVDVTEQVSARRQIEELASRAEAEKNRLRTILGTMPTAVSIFDASGKLIESNVLAEKYSLLNDISIYGSDGRKSTRRWWADTGLPVERYDLPLIKAITNGTTTIDDVFDVDLSENKRMTIMSSAAPIRDEHKSIVGGVLVQHDITAQRELEHDAIEAKERGELYIDLLTHDINNMNAGISGYLQLVSKRGDLDVKDKTYVQKSLDLLESSSHLIENVKKIQRIESGNDAYGITDLGWMLEDVVEELKDQPGKETTINYRPRLKLMVNASELLKDVFLSISSGMQ